MLLAEAATYEASRGEALVVGPEARVGIVDDGLARAYLTAGDGRQLTVRYVRAGRLIANVSSLAGERTPVRFEAVARSRITEFNVGTLFRLIRTDAAVGVAMSTEVSQQLDDAYVTLAATAFGSMRERIARHLLDRAGTDAASGRHLAPVTQRQLAEAIGTAREVVARALRDFRTEGLIKTRSGAVEILDAARLATLVGTWRTASRLDAAHDALGVDAFLDASPNPIVAIDERGNISYANPSAEATFGWSRQDLLGASIARLVPSRVADRLAGHVAAFFAEPMARRMGVGLDLTACRKDGTEFPVGISLAPFDSPGGRLVFATIVNIA